MVCEVGKLIHCSREAARQISGFEWGCGIGCKKALGSGLAVARATIFRKSKTNREPQTVISSRQTTPTSGFRHSLFRVLASLQCIHLNFICALQIISCRNPARALFTPRFEDRGGGRRIDELSKWLTQMQEHLQYQLLVCNIHITYRYRI